MLSAALILCLLPATAFAADPLGPGIGDWVVENPEQHGLDGKALKKAQEKLFRKYAGRKCFLVVKNGALVYEGYSDSLFGPNAMHEAWSMTKTLSALVVGWAASQGFLDIDKSVTHYGVESPKKYDVTSRQILSQAIEGDEGPGEKWNYDAMGKFWINKLKDVVRNATGRSGGDIWDFAFRKVLGFSSKWMWDPDGVLPLGGWATGARGTCRDFARIGQLMLNEGKWKVCGSVSSLVSSDYVRQMGTPQTKYGNYTNYSNPCYGLLTWVNADKQKFPGTCWLPTQGPGFPPAKPTDEEVFPTGAPHDLYFGDGAYGQIIMVNPSQNTVIISMGNDVGTRAIDVGVDLYKGVCTASSNCSKHYQEPPCQEDETHATIEGAGNSRSICAARCDTKACPTDVPPGTLAEPSCALRDPLDGSNYCALTCRSGGCPAGAACTSLGRLSICTYPESFAQASTQKVLGLSSGEISV